ncbi:MAG: L,D-transpeptidase family protein, partial [Sulfuriferula sp.]
LVTNAFASEAGAFSQAIIGGVSTYTVQAGDTLNKISARLGVPKSVLLADNRLKSGAKLRKGSALIVNNTHVVPEWMDEGITINLPQRTLYFFQNRQLVSTYPVGLGKSDWATPTGKFRITNMQMDKDWLVPLSIQEEMRREGHTVITRLPSGPQNPLGRHWIGLSAAGYGIHGTSSPASIYQFQSHGCIRSHPEDIAVLYQLAQVGMKVNIVYRTTMLAQTADGKLWLEVQPDVYQHETDPLGAVRALAEQQHLLGKLDWQKVYDVTQRAQGIAREVSLN